MSAAMASWQPFSVPSQIPTPTPVQQRRQQSQEALQFEKDLKQLAEVFANEAAFNRLLWLIEPTGQENKTIPATVQKIQAQKQNQQTFRQKTLTALKNALQAIRLARGDNTQDNIGIKAPNAWIQLNLQDMQSDMQQSQQWNSMLATACSTKINPENFRQEGSNSLGNAVVTGLVEKKLLEKPDEKSGIYYSSATDIVNGVVNKIFEDLKTESNKYLTDVTGLPTSGSVSEFLKAFANAVAQEALENNEFNGSPITEAWNERTEKDVGRESLRFQTQLDQLTSEIWKDEKAIAQAQDVNMGIPQAYAVQPDIKMSAPQRLFTQDEMRLINSVLRKKDNPVGLDVQESNFLTSIWGGTYVNADWQTVLQTRINNFTDKGVPGNVLTMKSGKPTNQRKALFWGIWQNDNIQNSDNPVNALRAKFNTGPTKLGGAISWTEAFSRRLQ